MSLVRADIDVSRTYLPLDPEQFPANLPEDLAAKFEKRTPVFAYDGWNILPLATGFTSFFGTNKLLGTDPLVDNVDELFLYKAPQGDNILFALAEDGIYIQFGDTTTPVLTTTGTGFTSTSYGLG